MTETDETLPSELVKMARDLSEIIAMVPLLDEQAEHKAQATLDGHNLPGGLAMVALGSVANREAWLNKVAAGERAGRDMTSAYEDDEDWTPPLQTLCFWSEQWRTEWDRDLEGSATIASEVTFLRQVLDWAWSHEPHWDDFATDIRDARVCMENVLYAGNRQQRTRVKCHQCDAAPRLIKLHGRAVDGSEDFYKCPACKVRLDESGYARAFGAMLYRVEADKFIRVQDAVATLVSQGRGLRTVRRWLEPVKPVDRCTLCAHEWEAEEYNVCPQILRDGDQIVQCGGELERRHVGDLEAVVEGFCDVDTHITMVKWPDLWHLHLTTRQTKRASA